MSNISLENLNKSVRMLMNKNTAIYSQIALKSESVSDGSCTMVIDTVRKMFMFKINGHTDIIYISPKDGSIKGLVWINDDIKVSDLLTGSNFELNEKIKVLLEKFVDKSELLKYYNKVESDLRFAVKEHGHEIKEITGLQEELDDMTHKSDMNNYYNKIESDLAFAAKDHIHLIENITGLREELDVKALKTDLDNYYTKEVIDGIKGNVDGIVYDSLTNKINISHPIEVSEINGMRTEELLTAEKIKASSDLTNYLRGPKGDPGFSVVGPQGPEGPQGPRGPKGEKGDSDSKSWLSWLLDGISVTGTVINAIAGSTLIQGMQQQILIIQGQIVAIQGQLGSLQLENVANEVWDLAANTSTYFGRLQTAWRNFSNSFRSRWTQGFRRIAQRSGETYRRLGAGGVETTPWSLMSRSINLMSVQTRDVRKNEDFDFGDINDDTELLNQISDRIAILAETCRFIASTERPTDETVEDIPITAIVGKVLLDQIILGGTDIIDVINGKINEIPPVDLTNYASITYVDTKINEIPKTDLTNYYTKTETDNKLNVETYVEPPPQNVYLNSFSFWTPNVSTSSTITEAQVGIKVEGYARIVNPLNQNVSITFYWSPDGTYENRAAEITCHKRGDGKWQSHYTFASSSPNFQTYPTAKMVGMRIYPYYKVNYLTKYNTQDNIQPSFLNLSKRVLTTETNTKNITSTNTTTALLGDLNVNLGKIIVKDTITNSTQNSDYVTNKDVDTKINAIPKTDLSNYYTKTDVDNKIAAIPKTDLSNYYTKTDSDNRYSLINHTHMVELNEDVSKMSITYPACYNTNTNGIGGIENNIADDGWYDDYQKLVWELNSSYYNITAIKGLKIVFKSKHHNRVFATCEFNGTSWVCNGLQHNKPFVYIDLENQGLLDNVRIYTDLQAHIEYNYLPYDEAIRYISNSKETELKNINYTFKFANNRYEFHFDRSPENGLFTARIMYRTNYDYVEIRVEYKDWIPTCTVTKKCFNDMTSIYELNANSKMIYGSGVYGTTWDNPSFVTYNVMTNTLVTNDKLILLSDTAESKIQFDKIKKALLRLGVYEGELW